MIEAEELTRGEVVEIWDEDEQAWIAGVVDDRDAELLTVRAYDLTQPDRPWLYGIPTQVVPQLVRTLA